MALFVANRGSWTKASGGYKVESWSCEIGLRRAWLCMESGALGTCVHVETGLLREDGMLC